MVENYRGDMEAQGKSSTRIHAPPGGGSTFSLGGGYGDDSQPKPKAQPSGVVGAAQVSSISFGQEETKEPVQQPAAIGGAVAAQPNVQGG